MLRLSENESENDQTSQWFYDTGNDCSKVSTWQPGAFTTNGSPFQTRVTYFPSSSGLHCVFSHLAFLFLLTDIYLRQLR